LSGGVLDGDHVTRGGIQWLDRVVEFGCLVVGWAFVELVVGNESRILQVLSSEGNVKVVLDLGGGSDGSPDSELIKSGIGSVDIEVWVGVVDDTSCVEVLVVEVAKGDGAHQADVSEPLHWFVDANTLVVGSSNVVGIGPCVGEEEVSVDVKGGGSGLGHISVISVKREGDVSPGLRFQVERSSSDDLGAVRGEEVAVTAVFQSDLSSLHDGGRIGTTTTRPHDHSDSLGGSAQLEQEVRPLVGKSHSRVSGDDGQKSGFAKSGGEVVIPPSERIRGEGVGLEPQFNGERGSQVFPFHVLHRLINESKLHTFGGVGLEV